MIAVAKLFQHAERSILFDIVLGWVSGYLIHYCQNVRRKNHDITLIRNSQQSAQSLEIKSSIDLPSSARPSVLSESLDNIKDILPRSQGVLCTSPYLPIAIYDC